MDELTNYEEQPWENPAESYYTDPPAPKIKKNRTGLKVAALSLCVSLIGGTLGAGGVMLLTRPWEQDTTEPSQLVQEQEEEKEEEEESQSSDDDHTTLLEGERGNTVIDISKIDTDKLLTAAEVYAANVNSTVGITTSITTQNFWGQQTTSAASGSGFIISDDGYILTNFHVIENANQIMVSDYAGNSYQGKVVGYDEQNDIAVLKVDVQGLSPVILGDSDNLNVGDSVVAIGNPLGELTFSLTTGVISAKDRDVTFSDGNTMTLLQTDCAINSGNSGGALFNLYGEVIGVTNAKYSSSSSSEASIDNIGFAIPLDSIRELVENIIEKGYVSKPYLGVSVSDVSENYQIYGLPAGAAIQSVEADSPAQKGGLKQGDIVTKAGEKEITCANDLINAVSDTQPGDSLELTIYRRGQTLSITITIGEKIQGNTSNSDR